MVWVAGGSVVPFVGDLDDYRAWVLRPRRSGGDDADAGVTKPASGRRAQKREEAQARQDRAEQRKPLVARKSAVEQDLERLGAEKSALDAWLAKSEAYADEAKAELVAALTRQGELTWTLARLESEWLDLAEALDKMSR